MAQDTVKKAARKKVLEEEKTAYMRKCKEVPCMHCGGTFPHYCMDFHHIDESTKHKTIGRKSFYRMSRHSYQVIDAEIEKCLILCACCHRKLHWLDKNPEEQ